jgi:hypothetical protein
VYDVESDLAFLSGDAQIMVPRMETSKYEITLSPALGGQYTGSVTFTAPNQQYLWYVITINVTRPPPEAEVPISSEMRKAVIAEVGIGNPTGEEQVFEVKLKGDGLIGADTIALGPYESKDYELVFAPLSAGIWEGSLSFHSEVVGEYWYKLLLQAHEPEPVELEDMHCDLGKSKAVQVLIQNPTDQELNLSVVNTNPINFVVSPAPLTLKPFQDATPTITYQPSAMDEHQAAQITFLSSRVGSWVFNVTGHGHPPTRMDEVVIQAPVGWSGNGNVVFRNPFATTMRFMAKLRGVGDGPTDFALMGKRATHTVEPFSVMQVSVSYSPKVIAEHRAVVTIQLMGQNEPLEWEFPILGVAEASSVKTAFKFVCAARKETRQILPLHLDQLDQAIDQENFTLEMVIPKDAQHRTSIERAVTTERTAFEDYQRYMNSGSSPKTIDPEMAKQHLFYSVNFIPLRPFSVTVGLVIRKATGGMWRYDVDLEALPPDPDDIIQIEAPLGRTESVSFHLTNIFPSNDPFTAYFTPETPSEFTVMPTKGVIMGMQRDRRGQSQSSNGAPAEAKGSQFVVSFTSTSYGKLLSGILCIDTQEMQWRYEVHGSLPKYFTPEGTTKLDRQLAPVTQERLKEAREARAKRNFMKENQAFVEQVSTLNKVYKVKEQKD